MKKRRIYFKGYYGYENLGDDVFTITSQFLINEISDDIEAYYLGESLPLMKKTNSTIFESKSRVYLRMIEFLLMFRMDQIIYFGGSLFEDAGTNIFEVKYLIRKLGLFNNKLNAFGISVGPFKDNKSKEDVKTLLNKFNHIYVRDYKSVKIMENMENESKTSFVFDPAIAIRSVYPYLVNTNQERRKNSISRRKVIGISLCRYEHFKGGNMINETQREETLKRTIEIMIENDEVERLKFFIFNGDKLIGDTSITEEFLSYFSEIVDVSIIDYTPDTKYMLNEMANCDFILGVRLHSGIISYALEIPFMLVEYHSKCTEFLNTIEHDLRFVNNDPTGNYNRIKQIMNGQKIVNPQYFERILLESATSLLSD